MLELYQISHCPYCKKVRQKLGDLNLDYICRNVESGTKKRETLIKLGGKDQVPFLMDMDKGIMMYESDEIVKYLDNTYSKQDQ
jgi:glutaredoxin 2